MLMSREDQEPLDSALAWVDEGHAVAVATVVETWGSSPRPRGSQVAIRDDGLFNGSVSGGCVEGKVVEAAQLALKDHEPRLLEFGVSNDDAWSVGLACGGTVRIHVSPIFTESNRGLGRDVLEKVRQARNEKKAIVLLTPLDGGVVRTWTRGDADLDRDLQAAVERALAHDDASTAPSSSGSIFVQAIHPPLKLVIVGAVHIAMPLARMATILGYEVTLIDPRTSFARAERWPGMSVIAEWPDEALGKISVDSRTAIVTLSHDPKIDDVALESALRTAAFYVGALGSKKSHAARLLRLSRAGFSAEQLARIHGPVGLKIGARSPAEIATSILAQMTEKLRALPPNNLQAHREENSASPRVAAIVLAAGLSRRMGGPNKLLAELGGVPVVTIVVDALVASKVDRVLVVVGHEADRVRAALSERAVTFVENADYEEGLGASLRAGIAAVGDDVDGALIALGDMPWIRTEHVNKLISAFERNGPRSICVPIHDRKRGHPVLWSSRHFPEMRKLHGDVGARALLEKYSDAVLELPIDDAAVHLDIDSPEMLASAKPQKS